MQSKTLYLRNDIKTTENERYKTTLEYYIVERRIGEEYCELRSYGIQINKTIFLENGSIREDRKLINDIFFDKSDVEKFIKMLYDNKVEPINLKNVIDDYIHKTIMMRRENKTA